MSNRTPFTLNPDHLLGSIEIQPDAAPVFDATWYVADDDRDGLGYDVPLGALASMRYVVFDLLLDDRYMAVFALELQEGAYGPVCQVQFGVLPQASARLRVPLALADHQQATAPREGAVLGCRISGERVNLARVDRLRVRVLRLAGPVIRWCMTPLLVTFDQPLPLPQPVLPAGRLLDDLGQSTLSNWPGKSYNAAEVIDRLQQQAAADDAPPRPEGRSRWGGWYAHPFDATGFFRTQWDDQRWWLVDPEGCAFWSVGVCGVDMMQAGVVSGLTEALAWLPDERDYELAHVVRWREPEISVNYRQAALMQAFGPNAWHTQWLKIARGQLDTAFNTAGVASDWLSLADEAFPYVRTLQPLADPAAPMLWRDLPDMFDAQFSSDAQRLAAQLAATASDPALLGYYVLAMPQWADSEEPPAAAMLYTVAEAPARQALAAHLQQQYGNDAALAQAWDMPVTLADVQAGLWDGPLTPAALVDLSAFSTVMLERYFTTLTAACRAVDGQHLNLGVVFPQRGQAAVVPGPDAVGQYVPYPHLIPQWLLPAMHSFDVVSVPCYAAYVPAVAVTDITEATGRPVLVSGFQFGALDVGLPASGPGPQVADQAARAQAYRVYMEQAAALPGCVGVHYHQFYDEAALGDGAGQAANTGLLDICHRPYEALLAAMRDTHQHIYTIATGQQPPADDLPPLLPPLYF